MTASIVDLMPLVRQTAQRLMRRMPWSVDVRDLVQAAMLRLLTLTSGQPGWQHNPGYVAKAARGAMLDQLRELDPLARSDRDKLQRLAAANAQISARLGYATAGDMASAAGISLAEVHRLLLIDSQSRAAPLVEEMPGAPDLALDAVHEPDQHLERAQSQALLAKAVKALPLRQRQAAQAQLAGESAAETAARLNVSPHIVVCWRRDALKALRRRLRPAMGL